MTGDHWIAALFGLVLGTVLVVVISVVIVWLSLAIAVVRWAW